MRASWRTVVMWSVVASVGVAGLYAQSSTWIVARQALNGESGADAMGRESVSVSADGRFVAFVSRAQLVPEDTNRVRDIYVLDLQSSAVTLESITTEGAVSTGDSLNPSISGNGRFVVFESLAMRLIDDPADRQPMPGLYLRDRIAHRTTRLNVRRDGQPFQCAFDAGAISVDGRSVVLGAPGDPFGLRAAASTASTARTAGAAAADPLSVYRVSLDTGAAALVSIGPDGQPAAADTFDAAISGNGDVVAFISTASLDPSWPWRSKLPPPFQMSQVYVRDLTAGTTTCVGCLVKDAGSQTRTHAPSMSADGRYIAFIADDITLSGKHPVLMAKIWLYDRVSSQMTLVTQSPRGHAPNGTSRHPVVSAHGDFVVFESDASNLLCDRRCPREARDANLLVDIYRFDRVSGTIRRISEDAGEDWWEPSVSPSMDADGRIVAFSSRHPIGPRDIEPDFDLHVWREQSPPQTH